MIEFKHTFHPYSDQPYWYTAHGQTWSKYEMNENYIIRNIDEIYKWCCENKLNFNTTTKGTNWRFGSEKDLTAFLLKWA